MSNNFEDATTDGLADDVPVGEDAQKLLKAIHTLEYTRLDQAQQFRTFFFWSALAFALVSVLASVFIVISTHIFGTQLATEVSVAFFASVTVEVLGLMAIIAAYLFPKDKGSLDPESFK